MPRCPECHRRLRGGAACPDDGRPVGAAPATDPGPPPDLPGFQVRRAIGSGGSGSVWEAVRPDGASAAFKVARAPGPHWRRGFAREAAAMAAVGAPHAPRVLGQGVLVDGRPWIAMELLLGQPLADELADAGRPDLARGGALTAAILTAVAALHRAGLVHRDLKPENLFVRANADPAGSIAVTDFGLAERRETSAAATAGFALGTLGYMAPEVLAGRAGDARADVYALGVVLFEVLTLRPPFSGDGQALEHAHMALRPPSLRSIAAVPPAVDELVLACLAKDPARRPADALELQARMVAALDQAASRAGPLEAPDAAAAELARPGDRSSAAGRQPSELVALVWIEPEAGPARLAADLARTPGILARQRGRTCIAVFAADRVDSPAAAALAAATRLLAAWGGRAALHVERAHVEAQDGRPPAIHGTAIDRADDWLPGAAWGGLVLSRAFVDALGDLAVVPAGPAGFFAPAGSLAPPPPPLVGRESITSALEARAAACFAGARPALITLVGGAGTGKSRLITEAAAAATRLGATVLRVDASDRRSLEGLGGESLRDQARRGPLAVLVDDAHLADDAALDHLEYATLDGAGIPLWVVVTGDGRALDAIRPRFGQRADRTERLELEPLSDAAMRDLAASLLVPADYVPAAVLDRLAVLAGGNPGRLSELVRALKREGAVRPRSDRRSHQVAIEAIERVPATAAGRWEASRALDALPPELAASARVAAALGPVIDQAELDWVEDAIERRDRQGSFFDAGVALHALASRDLVVERGAGTWAFTSPLLQDAIRQAMPAAERARIHQHALAYWRGRSGGRARAAMARHAGLAGAHHEAMVACLELAGAAAAAHRELEADRWYTEALLHIADQPTRMRALVGRGRVRWRLDRAPDALADLRAAAVLARELGATAEQAGALLDEAIVLDGTGDLESSAARVDEAAGLIEGAAGASHGLAARLLVGRGRTCWRHGQVTEAIELLGQGAARAADSETRLIALLLRGCALSSAGRLEEAEAAFGDAEDLARRTDDRLHRCGVHVNRMFLWVAREDAERGAEDLRRAVKLAREIGHPLLERAATHNLAELLQCEGRAEEALPLALRSFELQQRFVARHGPEDAVLLCRIGLSLGDRDSAHRHLAWIEAHARTADAAPAVLVFHRAAELVLRGGTAPAWDALVAEASGLLPVERLEVLALRAAAELSGGDIDAAESTLEAARTYTDRFPSWRARLDAMGPGNVAGGNTQQSRVDAAQKPPIRSS